MAKARKTDPHTSHDAARSVKNISATQMGILEALVRPRPDSELVEVYNKIKRNPRASESGIRSRRAELVAMGLVVDTGARVKLPSGRRAIVWGKK